MFFVNTFFCEIYKAGSNINNYVNQQFQRFGTLHFYNLKLWNFLLI